jgi:hypothetical protein
MYLPIVRNELPPFLIAFDFADPDVVTGKRSTTNVPAQALYFLNDPFVRTAATATARRLAAEAGTDVDRVERAYLLTLGRRPTADESALALAFVRESADADANPGADPSTDAWARLIQTLFGSTEFRMLD